MAERPSGGTGEAVSRVFTSWGRSIYSLRVTMDMEEEEEEEGEEEEEEAGKREHKLKRLTMTKKNWEKNFTSTLTPSNSSAVLVARCEGSLILHAAGTGPDHDELALARALRSLGGVLRGAGAGVGSGGGGGASVAVGSAAAAAEKGGGSGFFAVSGLGPGGSIATGGGGNSALNEPSALDGYGKLILAVDDLVFEVHWRKRTKKEREEEESCGETRRTAESHFPLSLFLFCPEEKKTGYPRRHEQLRRSQGGEAARLRGLMERRRGRKKETGRDRDRARLLRALSFRASLSSSSLFPLRSLLRHDLNFSHLYEEKL